MNGNLKNGIGKVYQARKELGDGKMTQSEELIGEIQKGLLQWYDFRPEASVLYMETDSEVGPDSIALMLAERFLGLICASVEQTLDVRWQQEHQERFDYIISVENLERQQDPRQALGIWRRMLKPDGRMLLGMNNRFGIRYFCGDRDPYTERNFDGVENYCRAYTDHEDTFQGRMYSQAEIIRMLRDAGWHAFRFYSVFSDLKNPSLIYGEDYVPNEDLATRIFPTYNYPPSLFLEEESLYAGLIENRMFHQMANAYLVECSENGELSDVLHVTSSMERGREHALFTVIHRSGIVEKRAAYSEGQGRLGKLLEHGQDLARHGIPVVEARMEGNVYVTPYVDAEVGQVYLKRLLQTDRERFLKEMDRFRDLILQSSEIVEPDKGDGQGAVLRRGYLDMVPLNCFHAGGTFLFYDQEFCEEYYPANAILTRMVATFYAGNGDLYKLLPMEALFERYGLTADLMRWRRMEWDFLAALRNEKALGRYHQSCRRSWETVNINRQRMNYSEEDYRRLFVDIFHNADTRKLVLFGSGIFAKKFLDLYSQDYPVYAVIDNNQDRWGQEVMGIAIQSPELLNRLQSGEYKVLVCIKNYLSVMKQLDAMGVSEYSIYDSHKDYPRKRKPTVQDQGVSEGVAPKKYHVGYIAGVFDLYHIGHLNMFKRAKEQCDYLIAGVVSDEGVRRFKGVEPFIPFEERIEMVRSCRHVDEAVEIPLNYGGTSDAYRLHHFDCQFSGSDYADHPDWLAEKEFLEKHGAEMVFFQYTESTSSSRIKQLIEKKLV